MAAQQIGASRCASRCALLSGFLAVVQQVHPSGAALVDCECSCRPVLTLMVCCILGAISGLLTLKKRGWGARQYICKINASKRRVRVDQTQRGLRGGRDTSAARPDLTSAPATTCQTTELDAREEKPSTSRRDHLHTSCRQRASSTVQTLP